MWEESKVFFLLKHENVDGKGYWEVNQYKIEGTGGPLEIYRGAEPPLLAATGGPRVVGVFGIVDKLSKILEQPSRFHVLYLIVIYMIINSHGI